jgi:hypothetical protein
LDIDFQYEMEEIKNIGNDCLSLLQDAKSLLDQNRKQKVGEAENGLK